VQASAWKTARHLAGFAYATQSYGAVMFGYGRAGVNNGAGAEPASYLWRR